MRNSGDEEACGRTTFNKVALSELREAAVKESITEAALASASSSPAGARPNTATPPKSVPPVPPLPRHISPKAHKRTEPEKLFPLDPTARPETAHARGSPRRLLSERRKYRGSTSAVPSPLYLGDSIPPNSLNKALLLDIGSARAPLTGGGWNPQELGLQNYRMGPMSAGPMGGVKSSSPLAVPELVDGYQPACIRKLSHPDAQLQSTPQKSTSPDILSKSAFNLGSRMSMDSNKAGTPGESGSTKHGFSRLFSPSPPSRRQQQPANSIDIQPTSPTVSSLVGDPAAQRRIRDQLASSRAFDRLLEEDDEFTMAISLTPTVAGERQQLNTPPRSK
ncbi:hypothetical protein GGF46_000867 [Coemansia sp. RSA 552]|nr:hypothetical protein GGF46_000867 [Coemansia sp. RSA 552]